MEKSFDQIMKIARKHMGSASRASTVKEAIEEIKELGPAAVHDVVNRFVEGLVAGEDSSYEIWRTQKIAECKAALDWDPAPLLEPGVAAGWASFDDYKPLRGHPTVAEALELTKTWVSGVGPGTLVLAGAPGVGKTHLGKAAARRLGELGRLVVWRQESRLIGELQSMMGKGGEVEQCLIEYGQMRWLVLDEFGATSLGNWGKATLDRIINDRWDNDACRTLITTNLTMQDMPMRIASRLGDKQRARALVIQAPDYRQQKR